MDGARRDHAASRYRKGFMTKSGARPRCAVGGPTKDGSATSVCSWLRAGGGDVPESARWPRDGEHYARYPVLQPNHGRVRFRPSRNRRRQAGLDSTSAHRIAKQRRGQSALLQHAHRFLVRRHPKLQRFAALHARMREAHAVGLPVREAGLHDPIHQPMCTVVDGLAQIDAQQALEQVKVMAANAADHAGIACFRILCHWPARSPPSATDRAGDRVKCPPSWMPGHQAMRPQPPSSLTAAVLSIRTCAPPAHAIPAQELFSRARRDLCGACRLTGASRPRDTHAA